MEEGCRLPRPAPPGRTGGGPPALPGGRAATFRGLYGKKRLQRGERVRIEEITDAFVTLNRAETTTPAARAVAVYRELQELQDTLSSSLREVFDRRACMLPRLG